jgi:hypothetical protein
LNYPPQPYKELFWHNCTRNRHLLSPSSGGYKSKVKLLAGLVPSEGWKDVCHASYLTVGGLLAIWLSLASRSITPISGSLPLLSQGIMCKCVPVPKFPSPPPFFLSCWGLNQGSCTCHWIVSLAFLHLSLFFFPETESCYVIQVSLKLTIFLPQSPECYDYRCAPPVLAPLPPF